MVSIAERRGVTTIELSVLQMTLLQVIYDEFRKQTVWPTMYAVDRAFIKTQRRGAVGAAAVIRDLPDGLLMRNHNRPEPMPQDSITLTISAVARCGGAESDIEAFLRAVRWCVVQELKREPVPSETSIRVNRQQLRRAIPPALRADLGSMDRLFELLVLHHWGMVGSGRSSDGAAWYLNLGPDVRRFKGVRTVEEFVDARLRWVEEDHRTHSPAAIFSEVQVDPTQESPLYLSPKVLRQLRGIEGVPWDTSKLVALADELDSCVRSGHVFAAHMVLRALLDHVPPLFGQTGFAGVVNSHPWGKTDRRYMNRLSSFRAQADDALHRQISKRPDLLMLDDMPEGAAVSVLLQACVAQLQKP